MRISHEVQTPDCSRQGVLFKGYIAKPESLPPDIFKSNQPDLHAELKDIIENIKRNYPQLGYKGHTLSTGEFQLFNRTGTISRLRARLSKEFKEQNTLVFRKAYLNLLAGKNVPAETEQAVRDAFNKYDVELNLIPADDQGGYAFTSGFVPEAFAEYVKARATELGIPATKVNVEKTGKKYPFRWFSHITR